MSTPDTSGVVEVILTGGHSCYLCPGGLQEVPDDLDTTEQTAWAEQVAAEHQAARQAVRNAPVRIYPR